MHGQSQFTAGGRRRRALTLTAATTALLLSTASAAGIEISGAPADLATAASSGNQQPTATINAIKLGRKQLRDSDSDANNYRGLKDKKKDDKKDKKKDKKANKKDDAKDDNSKKALEIDIDPSNLERPLLDFAVIGFPKTGTSFMEHYLFNTEETFIDNQENCFTDANMDMARHLISTREYTLGQTTNDGYRVKNAVKCPKDLMGPYSVANYAENFPEIKFVVSTRHPVWWFQSRYNYKLRQTFKHSDGQKIWAPPTSELLGACAEGTPYHYGNTGPKGEVQDEKATSVCTDGAKFHHSLSRMGKTPMNTPEELALLGLHTMSVHPMPKAKIFLMEIGQFDADDTVHANQLLADMKEFLGLEHELPPLPEHSSKNLKEEIQEHAINICDAEHDFVRAELVQTGREAYRWIKDYFMQSDDVTVSAEDHFLSLVEQWQFDPCDEATGRELS
mmetsp:Transcript_33477/g.67563  ORF Transcript_33477/g.67563 Transcript_33477/m.67563 type:complete len:449 (-) Transcript_33477:455-1801(-)